MVKKSQTMVTYKPATKGGSTSIADVIHNVYHQLDYSHPCFCNYIAVNLQSILLAIMEKKESDNVCKIAIVKGLTQSVR